MSKDEKRKFGACIFCNITLTGGKNGTKSREHIFGKSVAEYIDHKTHWHAPSNFNAQFTAPFDEVATDKGSSPITHLTSRSVCRNCNGGILRKQLESAFEPLCNLIDGKQCTLSKSDQEKLFLYFARFGCIVDVETSNLDLNLSSNELEVYVQKHGVTRSFDPIIDITKRSEILLYKRPKNIQVLTGHHKGILGKIIEFNISPTFDISGNLLAKRVSFAVGNLAVLIVLGLNPSGNAESFKAIPGKSELSWPAKPTVSYDHFYGAYSQTEQVRWMRQCVNNRKIRRTMESKFRKTSIWAFPHPNTIPGLRDK